MGMQKRQNTMKRDGSVPETLYGTPEIVELASTDCVGFRITTTMREDRKAREIPPFFHDVYDEGRLSHLVSDDDSQMFCIFDMHGNGIDFDYYVAVKGAGESQSDKAAAITLA